MSIVSVLPSCMRTWQNNNYNDDYVLKNKLEYQLIDIDDFKALSYSMNINQLDLNRIKSELFNLVDNVDRIEEKLIEIDNVIFG